MGYFFVLSLVVVLVLLLPCAVQVVVPFIFRSLVHYETLSLWPETCYCDSERRNLNLNYKLWSGRY